MPTTVTSKIGATNSPVTMDYTTLQSWEDACPANLVTDDKIWRGECYNQGEFTFSTSLTAVCTISGVTADATRYVELTTSTGASFVDDASVLTNPLKYDSTKGVAITTSSSYGGSVIGSIVPYTRISKLQVKSTSSTTSARLLIGTASGTNGTISQCLMQGPSAGAQVYQGGVIKHCVAIITSGTGTSPWQVENGSGMYGCTAVRCSDLASAATAVRKNYGTNTFKNNAFFGFSAITTGSGTDAGSNNATDLSSVGFGSNNQTSLTFTSQFEGTTSSAPDFRAKSTGSLDLNGTPDLTNTPTDIVGQMRHATTPTIGAWEVVASGHPAARRFGGIQHNAFSRRGVFQ